MSGSIFHQRDLSSGISRAIQEKKLVACFVRQDNEESEVWENEWLCDSTRHPSGKSLGELLNERAVILRITLGSQEASFLNSFCPVSRAPALCIINNGRVLEKIENGVDEDEFLSRVLAAVGLDAEALSHVGGTEDVFEAEEGNEEEEDGGKERLPESSSEAAGRGAVAGDENITPGDNPISAQPHTLQTDTSSVQAQDMLRERAARLEAERKAREAAEKAERIARMKARQRESYGASETQPNGKGKQSAASAEQAEKQKARDQWIYQQKKRKDEAKLERERILAQIQADKEERRAKEQRQREAQVQGGDGASSQLPASVTAGSLSTTTKASGTCSLQVRLFDGSSIRGKFPAEADIASTVRKWIDSASPEGGADRPYSFRQILAPRPSRSIEISEEHQSLSDLGLVPNATLVLVPVHNFTEAYSSAPSGYVGSALNAAYSAASTGYGMLGAMLSYVPGLGGSAASQQQQSPAPRNDEGNSNDVARAASSNLSTSTAPKIRMKTLADQRAEAARQQGADFYNGNSLKFEGRNDQDESKK